MEKKLSSDQKEYAQEATLTRKVKEYLEVQPDVHFYKASDRYHKGVSDVIICVRGIFVGAELKASKNKATPHQKLFISMIKTAGGVGGVCYTLADVKALVEEARGMAGVRQREG